MTTTGRDWQCTLELTYQHMATRKQIEALDKHLTERTDRQDKRMNVMVTTDQLQIMWKQLTERMDTLDGRFDGLEAKIDTILEVLQPSHQTSESDSYQGSRFDRFRGDE